MATSWAALVVELPSDLPRDVEDELAGLLGVGTLGVEIEPLAPGRSRVRVYAASEEQATRLAATAEAVLRGSGAAVSVEQVPDLRWVERYQEGLRPFPAGTRFLVVPHGPPPSATDREPILLVPGRAFGTGEHATTRLCIEALERSVTDGSRWLDLGCGSGILSVVAARCGAALVDARDLDAEAVEVALEVAAANGVEDRVRIALGSAADLAGSALDGVVANIAVDYFLSNAAEVASVLRPGGILLAAGFLRQDVQRVSRALSAASLVAMGQWTEGDWALLASRR